jgi:phosphoribosylglycinamide formyltransferase-1
MQSDQNIKWAILVTGWGRNAKDTIKAYTKGKLANSTINLVIYEEEPCGAKDYAEKHGIETLQLIKRNFPNLLSYQEQLTLEIKKRNIDYIFMLNFKYIIKEPMLKAFPNKIINIHPSLFPSFLATKTAIQDALDYGVKITGITTHIIDDKVDEGIILCQRAIKVSKNDNFETLYPKFAKKGKKIVLKTISEIEKLHLEKLDK